MVFPSHKSFYRLLSRGGILFHTVFLVLKDIHQQTSVRSCSPGEPHCTPKLPHSLRLRVDSVSDQRAQQCTTAAAGLFCSTICNFSDSEAHAASPVSRTTFPPFARHFLILMLFGLGFLSKVFSCQAGGGSSRPDALAGYWDTPCSLPWPIYYVGVFGLLVILQGCRLFANVHSKVSFLLGMLLRLYCIEFLSDPTEIVELLLFILSFHQSIQQNQGARCVGMLLFPYGHLLFFQHFDMGSSWWEPFTARVVRHIVDHRPGLVAHLLVQDQGWSIHRLHLVHGGHYSRVFSFLEHLASLWL